MSHVAPDQNPSPFFTSVTPAGARVARYAVPLEQVPADFFADPDGAWSYEGLAEAAGFAVHAGVAVGALRHAWAGHPAGSAVVTLNAAARPYVALIECPVAYVTTGPLEHAASAA
jgi:hypothetical protein